MIERWTIWQVPGDDGQLVLQCSLAVLDPATWDVLREITCQVGPDRSYGAVRARLHSDMEEWIAVNGIQMELWG